MYNVSDEVFLTHGIHDTTVYYCYRNKLSQKSRICSSRSVINYTYLFGVLMKTNLYKIKFDLKREFHDLPSLSVVGFFPKSNIIYN